MPSGIAGRAGDILVSVDAFTKGNSQSAIGARISKQVAQRYAPFAFLCGSSLTVIEASNPGVFIGGQQHPVDFEPARRGDGALDAARVVMHA